MELRAATLALGMAGILSALSPAMASQPSDKERGRVDIPGQAASRISRGRSDAHLEAGLKLMAAGNPSAAIAEY